MKDNFSNYRAICSLSRALLGAISCNLRAASIYFELDSEDNIASISLYFYFYNNPTDQEIEDMEIVGSEVISDFPHAHNFTSKNIITPIGVKLPNKGLMVFERKEG